jgi:hypothetical protein
VRALSAESLRWPLVHKSLKLFEPLIEYLREVSGEFQYFETRRQIYEETERLGAELNRWIVKTAAEGHRAMKGFGKLAGMTFDFNLEGLRVSSLNKQVPSFQVHSLRTARRVGPDGDALNQLIISLIQSRDVPLDPSAGARSPKMTFRGGCTLILDLDTMRVRYAVKKDIADEVRLGIHREYRLGLETDGSLRATYFRHLKDVEEPFALLHRSFEYGRP